MGENEVVLFQDEASIQYAPTITRMWSLKGQQPVVYTPGGRKRQHLIGTVDPLDGRVIVAFSEGLKSVQFQQYLEGLLSRYPPDKKLLLVLDNA
ncbi:MAG: transposase, partial [Promethearchaeota archaeon]